MADLDVFQRVEKKYILNDEQYAAFLKKIEPYMLPDGYGRHTICNIYYDTEDYELIRRSIDKPDYKEKLRVRSYGVPNAESLVFVEIKKKVAGVVYKRRIKMTYAEAVNYLNGGVRPNIDSQILREIDYFVKVYKPVPKLYLAYDRVAYYSPDDPSLRITFDENIRSREDDLDMSHGSEGVVLSGKQEHLLELKLSQNMPLWLAGALSELRIYPVSFSKYGTIYSNKVKENMSAVVPVYLHEFDESLASGTHNFMRA